MGILATIARLWNLGHPHAFVFDETYYAKDAYSLLNGGISRSFVSNADVIIINGSTNNVLLSDPSFTVHPEVGKWMIALGIDLFGMDPFGWRFSAAIIGGLSVVVLARIVWHLTFSVWASTFAGFLLAIDGLHFTMSRISMLDIFLTFWILLGVLALVIDRHRTGWVRPWQILAGVCFGFAIGTKWSALYVLAAFGIAVWLWDRKPGIALWLRSGLAAFARIVLIALLVYLATWSGWLRSSDQYLETFGSQYGWTSTSSDGAANKLHNLLDYHRQVFAFHTGEYISESTHPYASRPESWPLLLRPVNGFAENSLSPKLCGADSESVCVQQLVLLGNPVIWWGGIGAVLISLVAALRSRHWRWSIPLLGIASTWLPWFLTGPRPIFQFYAVTLIPFIIIAISLVAHRGLAYLDRRKPHLVEWGAAVIIGYGLLALIAFWFFLPIWTAETISRDAWTLRMWLNSWI